MRNRRKLRVKPAFLQAKLVERFWSRVDRRGPNECWEWVACRSRRGYGRTAIFGKVDGAHRVAYRLAKARIPTGLMVRHRCDNPPCCNPQHLVVGTAADNSRDMVQRRHHRALHGITSPTARLTEAAVTEIRQAALLDLSTITAFLAKFGCSEAALIAAHRRLTWRHVA
jgi:hypothetical protein